MANILPIHKKIQILQMLCEGVSMRGISRITGCSINTVDKLLVETGRKCDQFHHLNVRNLGCTKVQVDEIHAFCYAREKNVDKLVRPNNDAGDVWTWTAVCPDSKLVINWHSGERGLSSATRFMRSLADKLTGRVQITSDGHNPYIQSVEAAFGGNVDFGMLVKNYKNDTLDIQKRSVLGNPKLEHISTSHVERQNLTMRMSMRRFTRRTNAHSKKLENHCHALSLYFCYFNFVRIHSGLHVTPAMEAKLTDRVWSWEDIIALK